MDREGVYPHQCRVCAHAADFDRGLVCMEYGAYILRGSSCKSFEGKEKGLRVVNQKEVDEKFGPRLADLRGWKG